MKLAFLAIIMFSALQGVCSASVVMINYQATGLFSPENRAVPQTGFSFAFSVPVTALDGVASYSTSSTLHFSNGLSVPSTLTFTPTVLKQVLREPGNLYVDCNEFDFYEAGLFIPSYRFFLAGDNLTDGRRSDTPADLTNTRFVAGTHTGGAESMITYPVNSPFAIPGTSFVTTPVDRFTITGTVTPVPEVSSSITLMALLTCAFSSFVTGRRATHTGTEFERKHK
jgi:hypothetical protein